MAQVWEFGFFVSLAIFGSIWLYALGVHLLALAKGFVFDERPKWPSWSSANGGFRDGCDAAIQLAMCFLLVVFGPIFWPLTWLVLIVVGALFASRKAVRFNKAYQAHKHDSETGSVI